MKDNKKGMSSVMMITAVIGFLLVISFIPTIVNQIASADRTILECNAVATPTLNESFAPPICCNATGQCDTNSTPSAEGLTGSEETLLKLTPLFLAITTMMGFIVWFKRRG